MKQDMIERGQASASIGEGLRRLTPGLMRAEKLAHELEGTPLPARHQIKNAVAVLRGASRLTFSEAETLGVLIDFCGTWEAEGVATVFATNGRLRSRLCGVNDDRAMRARLAALGRRGFICHVERPGGRRGVEIDPENGERVYYGISLLPLVALLPEVGRIEAIREAEYAERMKLTRKARSMMTRIETLASAAIELGLDFAEWQARVDLAADLIDLVDACDDIADLTAYADELEAARDDSATRLDEAMRPDLVTQADLSTAKDEEVLQNDGVDSGYPESSVPPETINKPLTDKSEQCTASRKASGASPRNPFAQPALNGVGVGLEDKPGGAASSVNYERHRQIEMYGERQGLDPALAGIQPAGSDMSSVQLIQREIDKYQIMPNHLTAISEGMAAYLPYGTEDDPEWKDVAAAAFALRPVIGLSERGWKLAVQILGVNGAAVAMAVATADVNRAKIRKSAAEYIVWMANFTKNGGHVGIGAKLRSAVARNN